MIIDTDTSRFLGIEHLPFKDQISIHQRLQESIEKRVLVRVLSLLSPEIKDQYLDLVERDLPEELSRFISQHVSDLSSIIEEEAGRVVEEFRKV